MTYEYWIQNHRRRRDCKAAELDVIRDHIAELLGKEAVLQDELDAIDAESYSEERRDAAWDEYKAKRDEEMLTIDRD